MELHQFENINILLSTFLVACISAIIFLYQENKRLVKEHKEDLRLFDGESKKTNEKYFDILNKLYLTIEKGNLSDEEVKRNIERIIKLLEDLRDGK